MRVAALAFLFLLGACGAQSSAQPSPAATSSSSPKALYAFTCRVPVLWFNQDPRVDGKTGFVNFPAGSLSTSNATLPAPAQLTLSFSYDQAIKRWLGVPLAAIAPDGLHYAYAEYDPPGPNDGKAAIGRAGRVHVADAQTGADQVIYSGSPTFSVVDFTAGGLYLAQFGASIGGSGRRGLYLIDPAGGTPRLVPGSDVQLDAGGWQVLDGGGAWGTRFSEGGAMWSGNELVRLDMTTGEIVTWLTVPTEEALSMLGFDAGRAPVTSRLAVTSTGQSSQISVRLMTCPGQSRQLYSSDSIAPGQLGVGDAHGTWMGGAGSIWLYQPASGLRPIQVLNDLNAVVWVGGACS
jgi:hypothetical protein